MVAFDLLYGIIFLMLIPLWLKKFSNREYISILKGRFSPRLKPERKKRIWIHAVSVGEVKSLGFLIERLKNQYNQDIVLSVTTPTGFQVAKQMYTDVKVINAPLDFSFIITKFIGQINPEILILNELEIWPNWILIVKKYDIPIVLINGRVSDSAFKRYRVFRFFLRQFFAKIDLFLVQAELFKRRFSRIGIPAKRIVVCGNIKADEAFQLQSGVAEEGKIFKYLKIIHHDKPILTLASSHASDEKVMFPAIRQIQDKVSVIVVPRHLDRIGEIKKQLAEYSIKYTVWSEAKEVDLGHQVLIFDKIGYLFNILAVSDIVFMGGTFSRGIGGHNLYEPAVLGKLIVGGPYFNNFPVIGRELINNRVYLQIADTKDLLDILENLSAIDFNRVKSSGRDSVTARKGSVECILNHIRQLIKL